MSLPGIRVEGCQDDESFAVVFEPILPALARFWWDDSPLEDPRMAGDPVLSAVWESIDANRCIPPDTLLPRFARYVRSFDWITFYGFGSDPGPAARVRQRLQGRSLQRLPDEVEIQFQNVDGAFWCFFARDESLLRRVADHAMRQPGWSVRRLTWGQTFWGQPWSPSGSKPG